MFVEVNSLELRKKLLFGINALNAVAGLVLVVVGFHFPNLALKIGYIAVGVVSILVSAYGISAARKNVILNINFRGLLVIIVLAIIAQECYVIWLASGIRKYLDFLFQNFMNGWSSILLEDIQSEIKCCGVDSPEDWKKYYPDGQLPRFCCDYPLLNGQEECNLVAGGYTRGCYAPMIGRLICHSVGGFIMLALQIALIQLSFSVPDATRTVRIF